MSQLKLTKVWSLEKYARFLQDTREPVVALPQPVKESASSITAAKKPPSGGSWKHYQSSKDGSIQLALLESNHLMISSGNHIYESFSLWEAKKWIKGITKGDSILFIYRLNEENRRFRIKFSKLSPDTSSIETCRDCISVLSPLIPIREMSALASGQVSTISHAPVAPQPTATTSIATNKDSQLTHNASESQMQFLESQATYSCSQRVEEMDVISSQSDCSQPVQTSSDSAALGSYYDTAKHPRMDSSNKVPQESSQAAGRLQPPLQENLISVPDIAKSVKCEGNSLGGAYAATNFPTEQLGSFIRLCLTDSNFPSFVAAVEKEMMSITQGK